MKNRSKVTSRYVDGYVLALPKNKINFYRRMAKDACKVWKKNGALDYKECIGDDLKTQYGMPFTKCVRTKSNETVVFAYIVYKSRKHRDTVNAKVMKEMTESPEMKKYMKHPMPFDMKRMAFGGFKIIVSS